MTRPPRFAVGALSHIGLVRRENQDRMGRFRTSQAEFFVVADGMGGHKGGSQAASMVLDGLQSALCARPQPRSLRAALRSAAGDVNLAVCAAATSGDPTTDHMGSTAVLLVVRGREVLVGHLGDSRAYLWRQGRLRQLTRDHTWVQQLVDQNLLTEEEARNHPEASVLAHAFGRQSELPIALSPALAIRRGDAILLCSDGLSGYLEADEIAAVLARHDDPQRAAEALVEAALAVGGHDNITMQLIVFAERPGWHSRRVLRRDGISPSRHTRTPQPAPAPAPAAPSSTSPPAPEPAPACAPAEPELAPTEPALPLPRPATAAQKPRPRPRRRRVAGGLVVLATLAGGALLVVGLRSVLRPAVPAGQEQAAPAPTEPAVPSPVPSPAGDPPATVAPPATPTPTVTPVPTVPVPGSGGAPTGGVP